MASGWTESGIDWNNLQNQSPRDVIRELYIAVSERNFWVKYFGSGGYNKVEELEPIDYNATERVRTKEQIDFILNAVSNWLRPSSAPRQIGNDLEYRRNGYRGCFIDYESGSNYAYDKYGADADFKDTYYAPKLFLSRENTLIEEIQLGYNSFNKDESGRLEQLAEVDLSFIRAFDEGESSRFTHESMSYVFKLLNFLTYARICNYRDGSYDNRSAVTSLSNFNVIRMGQGDKYVGNTPSFEVSRDNLYNDVFARSYLDGTILNPKLNITGYNVYNEADESWNMYYGGYFNACTFTNISVKGLDEQIFKTEFFDYKTAIYNLGYSYDFFNDISYSPKWNLPSRPLGHTMIDNNIDLVFNESNSEIGLDIDIEPEGYWLKNGFGRVVNGDIPNSIANESEAWSGNVEGIFIEQSMPMINFNKEGFLKYYTEDN